MRFWWQRASWTRCLKVTSYLSLRFRIVSQRSYSFKNETSRLGAVAYACNPSTFGRPRQAHHLRSGVQDQPGQHGETPSLLKIQKLAGGGGTCL